MKIKISKSQWEKIGKKTGWMKVTQVEKSKYHAIINGITKLLTNPDGTKFVGKFLFRNTDIFNRILTETQANVLFTPDELRDLELGPLTKPPTEDQMLDILMEKIYETPDTFNKIINSFDLQDQKLAEDVLNDAIKTRLIERDPAGILHVEAKTKI